MDYNPGRFCCHFAKRDNFGRQEVVFLVFDSIKIGATLEGKNFVSSCSKFFPLRVTYNKKGDNKLFHFGVSTLWYVFIPLMQIFLHDVFFFFFSFCMMYLFIFLHDTCIWATPWEDIPSYMCTQRRLKSACTTVQSDQSLSYPHAETLQSWLSQEHLVKILIRLHKCAAWSKSSLGAHVKRYVYWHCGWLSFNFILSLM